MATAELPPGTRPPAGLPLEPEMHPLVENNHDLVADEMRIAEITVDEGPTLRRFRPRAQGRATRINKRTSHIAVALSPEDEE